VLDGGSHWTIQGGEEGSYNIIEGIYKVKVKGCTAKEEAITAMLRELNYY